MRVDTTKSHLATEESQLNSTRHLDSEPESPTHPLSTNFFMVLLKLEDKYLKHDYTIETLNEMITHYARCVEFYDTNRDPIKIYFLEKIQKTIANRETLKVLLMNTKAETMTRNNQNKVVSRRKSISYYQNATVNSSSSGLDSDSTDSDMAELEEVKPNHFRQKSSTISNTLTTGLQNTSLHTKRASAFYSRGHDSRDEGEISITEDSNKLLNKNRFNRSRKIDVFLKMETTKNSKELNGYNMISEIFEKKDNLDNQVCQGLKLQDQKLAEKLKARENRKQNNIPIMKMRSNEMENPESLSSLRTPVNVKCEEEKDTQKAKIGLLIEKRNERVKKHKNLSLSFFDEESKFNNKSGSMKNIDFQMTSETISPIKYISPLKSNQDSPFAKKLKEKGSPEDITEKNISTCEIDTDWCTATK